MLCFCYASNEKDLCISNKCVYVTSNSGISANAIIGVGRHFGTYHSATRARTKYDDQNTIKHVYTFCVWKHTHTYTRSADKVYVVRAKNQLMIYYVM